MNANWMMSVPLSFQREYGKDWESFIYGEMRLETEG
jgi:hypothetical protein